MKASLKVFLMAVWLLVLIVPAILARQMGKKRARNLIKRLFCRGVLGIIGITIEQTGELAGQRPLVVVSNHVSYLDIVVLAACCDVCFTPKKEIEDWPVIGTLCWLMDSIYIDRRPEKIKQTNDNVLRALSAGEVVAIFPEATTSNGTRVLPFKSGVFSLAEQPIDGRAVTVQPAILAYSTIHGLPIDLTQWPKIAWYGDSELIPHVWEMLLLGRIKAKLIFQEPVDAQQFDNRKLMAEHCHRTISQCLENARTNAS